jgi:DNA-binding MarR family transcriptional regulator
MKEFVTDVSERESVCNLPSEALDGQGDLKRLSVLVALERHGEMTTSGVRDVTTLSANDMSYHVGKLEERELVTVRRHEESDERSNRPNVLVLSQRGRKALEHEEFGVPADLWDVSRVDHLQGEVQELRASVDELETELDRVESNTRVLKEELASLDGRLEERLQPVVVALLEVVTEETGRDPMELAELLRE